MSQLVKGSLELRNVAEKELSSLQESLNLSVSESIKSMSMNDVLTTVQDLKVRRLNNYLQVCSLRLEPHNGGELDKFTTKAKEIEKTLQALIREV